MEPLLISPIPGSVYEPRHERQPELRRPSNPPDAEDWERYKDIILHAYDDKDWPLPEVRTYMESYHFYASDRMYKRRFDKWEIRKNYTKEDVDVVFDDITGGRVDFDNATIHGRPVVWQRAMRHLNEAQISLLQNFGLPSRSAARRPRRQSSISSGSATSFESLDSRQAEFPLSPVLETHSDIQENGQILVLLERYLDTNLFSSQTGNIFGPTRYNDPTALSPSFHHPSQLNSSYARGMVLLRNGHTTAGFALLSQAVNALQDLFQSHHPALASCFLDAFMDTDDTTIPWARSFVTNHAAVAARKVLPATHPLTRLCDIVQVSLQSHEEMKQLLWFCEKFCEMVSNKLTKKNRVAAYVNLKHFAKLMQVQQFTKAYHHLTNHVEPAFMGYLNSEDVPKEMRAAALCYLRRKAHLNLSVGKTEEAKESLQLAVQLTIQWVDDTGFAIAGNPLVEECFRVIDEMGEYVRLIGEEDRALDIQAFALEICTQVRGEREGKTMRMVSALSQHYINAKKTHLIPSLRLRFPEVFETESTLDTVPHILPCSSCGNGQDTQNFCEDHRVIDLTTAAHQFSPQAIRDQRSRIRTIKEYLAGFF